MITPARSINDRDIALWCGRIASAASNGAGLDGYFAALTWVKQNVPTDNGLRETQKEIQTPPSVILLKLAVNAPKAIYLSVFQEATGHHDELDTLVTDLDKANEIRRAAHSEPIQYALRRKGIAHAVGIGVIALDDVRNALRQKNGGTK